MSSAEDRVAAVLDPAAMAELLIGWCLEVDAHQKVVVRSTALATPLMLELQKAILAREAWQVGALFFVLLSIAMLPAAFLAGGADAIQHRGAARASMSEVLGQAMRNRQFLVMSGAYFVCGLNLMFLTTHVPA